MATQFVKIKGLKKLSRRLLNIGRAVKGHIAFSEIGTYLAGSIKTRTLRGRDVDNKFFKPYSDRHRFVREQKGLPTNVVDLFFTGSMFGSLTHDASDDSVKVFFMPGTDRKGNSNPAKAFYLQQDREFFGMTDEDVEEVIDIYQEHVERSI